MWPYDTPVEQDSMGFRLCEERLRLGLEAYVFCQALGIDLERLQALETNMAPADAMELATMSGQGVDLPYLLTGQRSRTLSEDEQAFIEQYRKGTDAQQRHLKAVIDAAS